MVIGDPGGNAAAPSRSQALRAPARLDPPHQPHYDATRNLDRASGPHSSLDTPPPQGTDAPWFRRPFHHSSTHQRRHPAGSVIVKIDLIVTGDTPDDVISVLRLLALGKASAERPARADRVAAAPATDPQPITAVQAAPATVPAGHWADNHVTAFWRFLTDDVRDIYRLVAHTNRHTIAHDSLLDAVEIIAARALSGRLSSTGPRRTTHPPPSQPQPAPPHVLRQPVRHLPDATRRRRCHPPAQSLNSGALKAGDSVRTLAWLRRRSGKRRVLVSRNWGIATNRSSSLPTL